MRIIVSTNRSMLLYQVEDSEISRISKSKVIN